MTTTTMHFGPEWMRTKQGSSRPAPSPPLTTSPAPPGNSTYSALVTPASNPPSEGRDMAHPFRYSKEDMLRIYKEGGGRGGLGIEVERWEGIVREVGYDPVALKEMGDVEKKLFAGPLNSEARRRQSTDFLSPVMTTGLGERPKLNHSSTSGASPMRERIGTFMGRRRGDSTDQAPLSLPRKLSLSNMQGALASPRETGLPSPRIRPGFDGVLSDTWSSRRRTAEKVGVGAGRTDKEANGESKGPNIKEEEEDAVGSFDHGREYSGGTSGSDKDLGSHVGGLNGGTSMDQVNGQLGSISIAGQNPAPVSATNQAPPGLQDLSKVDWSYLDPQGQVQGPFTAETMQRWHEQGYFQSTLLMKRTHLDTSWTSVGDLVRRAGDQPVFLSPLVHAVTPPGLLRPLESVVDRAAPERNQHSPYQPVPTRNIRSSTLDSFLQNGSSASESPSSSFGGRYVNGSPDPGPFDNRRNGQIALDHSTESRIPFATPSTIGTPGQRRATVTHAADQYDSSSRGFGGRIPGVDASGSNGADRPSVLTNGLNGMPFGQRGAQDIGHMNGFTGSSALNGPEYALPGGMHSNQGTPSRVLNRDTFGKPPVDEVQPASALGGSFSNKSSPFLSHAQAYPQTPLAQYASQENRSLQPITPLSERQGRPFPQQFQQPYPHSPNYSAPQSPWLTQDAPPVRRPGPFDVAHPTVNNTFIAQPITLSHSFGHAPQSSVSTDQSPWPAAQSIAVDRWGAPATSLTVANLTQHDDQQRQAELSQQAAPAPPATAPQPVLAPTEESQPQTVPAEVAISSPTDSVTQKPRGKSGDQPTVAPQPPKDPVVSIPSSAPVRPASPVLQPEVKAPWAVDEEKKSKSGATLNLREIQEAEAKKAGARKAPERERVTRASSQSEDFQPFTTSWGLPTSQVGARANSASKETPTAPSSTPSTPAVWTNTTKAPAAKKTMKEIQEEERRKKIAAKEKETAAARRAYADTTTKPAAPALAVGGAWTTVGSNGKSTTAVIAGARPAAVPIVSTKAVPTVSAVVAVSPAVSRPAIAAAQTPQPVTVKSVPSKEENTPAPGPSPEFLKWISDSLKGLNNSINLQETMSMLLSFPLDPDPSTTEIISDLIYASSTTLDGRRFASEFVSRRKADVASRPKGAAAVSSAKQLSIADVVKTQPKPAQSEWGGFKVVNKKKKGGRA